MTRLLLYADNVKQKSGSRPSCETITSKDVAPASGMKRYCTCPSEQAAAAEEGARGAHEVVLVVVHGGLRDVNRERLRW